MMDVDLHYGLDKTQEDVKHLPARHGWDATATVTKKFRLGAMEDQIIVSQGPDADADAQPFCHGLSSTQLAVIPPPIRRNLATSREEGWPTTPMDHISTGWG